MVLDSLPQLFFTSYLLTLSADNLELQLLSVATSGSAVAFMVAELSQDIDTSLSFRKKRELAFLARSVSESMNFSLTSLLDFTA